MPYISMNEHINLAFIVSSNYSMNVFVDQIWVCIYFACDVLARRPPPPPRKIQKLFKRQENSLRILQNHLLSINKVHIFDKFQKAHHLTQ